MIACGLPEHRIYLFHAESQEGSLCPASPSTKAVPCPLRQRKLYEALAVAPWNSVCFLSEETRYCFAECKEGTLELLCPPEISAHNHLKYRKVFKGSDNIIR